MTTHFILDETHSHSTESINAINQAIRKVPSPIEALNLILAEWADDADLIDIAKFLNERLDENFGQ